MEALIYGYLRDDLAEGHREELEAKMNSLAREEGLCFAATFHEETGGDGAAFAELTQELVRADAHHVVVPSLDHLAGQTIPRDILLAKLAHEAAARVWTIEDTPRAASARRRAVGAAGGSEACADGYRTDRTASLTVE